MMKRAIFIGILVCAINVTAQAQNVAIKTNMLYWATTTPNLGTEFAINRHFTTELWGAYNSWKFKNQMKLNIYMIQPEVRYWPCQKFEGHFFGIHGHFAHFNMGMVPFISSMKDILYRGDLYGGGVSYGYHWAIASRWGLELNIGAGYMNLKYDKYQCADCAEPLGSYQRNYFGITRAGISVLYFIR